MDPFDVLVTPARLVLMACLAGVLAWAAHLRAAAYRVWRRHLRGGYAARNMSRSSMIAATAAGLV